MSRVQKSRAGVRVHAKQEKLMWEALREAHDEEMERDPTVVVMGENGGCVLFNAHGGRLVSQFDMLVNSEGKWFDVC